MTLAAVTSLKQFADDRGNEIRYEGTHDATEVKITFAGAGNKVIVEPDATLGKLIVDFLGNGAEMRIGGASSARVWIRTGSASTITLGRGLSTTGAVYITAFEGSSVELGRDCMLAGGVEIRADDAHPIFDVKTGDRINVAKSIVVGEHVWLGEGSVVLGGSQIGGGSTVGMRSVVKCKAPNNCILAGVPARVVKRDIAWERPHLSRENLYTEDGLLKDMTKEHWRSSDEGEA